MGNVKHTLFKTIKALLAIQKSDLLFGQSLKVSTKNKVYQHVELIHVFNWIFPITSCF